MAHQDNDRVPEPSPAIVVRLPDGDQAVLHQYAAKIGQDPATCLQLILDGALLQIRLELARG